jgi:hypothetical protein
MATIGVSIQRILLSATVLEIHHGIISVLITHWSTNENVLVALTLPYVPTLVSVVKIKHVACIVVLLLAKTKKLNGHHVILIA